MILIGIGANLPSRFGPPLAACEAALTALEGVGVHVLIRSRWYESAPVPISDDPWYVNGVARVGTDLGPEALLAALHRIEADFGRVRTEVNAPRVLDLDLLEYDGRIRGPEGLILPHPRMHLRAFVLLPLAEIAPDWRHPALKQGPPALISSIPPDQTVRPLNRGDS
jgi:2-amino-4-hydroxy-6-hydroxymethyldihydropteridine diphosphokinase